MTTSYYITTPIYYVNDKPHIGHAYTSLACDVLARFKRMDGHDVCFLTGTDEYGQKIEKSATDRGITPQALTDQFSQNFRDLTTAMNFSNDDFIRTTEPRHQTAVQALWQRLVERDYIYQDTYAGWYAIRDEAYYTEDELTDTEDGKKIAPSGAEVAWVEEPSYFFRLSKFTDKLLEFYEQNPDFIAPQSRRNEVISFVKGGLKDLSVSRTTFSWGVPVQGDDDHITYVWLDALTNYLTAIGFPDMDNPAYKKFWGADLHMVGKDIIRFHAVYWPAFLMAADLPLPKRVFAHGWWTNEGQKISKSLGNVIDPYDLINKYGLDQTRFFMLREVPFGNDGDFRHESMVGRMNYDLANNLGNLCQRSLSMIAKNCDGKIPPVGDLTADDQKLLNDAYEIIADVRTHLDNQAFNRALESIWSVVGHANSYMDAQAPWALRKTDFARMETVLWVMAETVRVLGLLVRPFMPMSADSILDLVAVGADERTYAHLKSALKSGTGIPKPQGVFPRYVDEEQGAE